MKRSIFIFLSMAILSGCGKHSSDNPNPGGSGGNNPPPAPSAATLSAPAQNSACNSGTIVSTTQSSITFTWNASANTTKYELNIKNLLDNSLITDTTSQTQLTVSLLRGTPYSWYVVSKSSKTTTTAQSDIWKFYNAGPGITTYVPFPAEFISPTFGQQLPSSTTSVNLTWHGSSVTNESLTFDVYFGTSNTFSSAKDSGTTDSVYNVKVQSGTTYYWKIVSKDVNGNSSDSGVSQFSVQ
ncbi:MAG: membrane lipoprotein lipid attachment site-containing protein [Bacteroidetes bacterium]|nr:membrane lipoprotein lipid attachment site-containing protein [Bacteroidota bacterium]